MNDEQKYKQALEKARECMKDGGISQNTIDYLCNIFPELAESDDERIKNDIRGLIEFALEDGSAIAPGRNTTKEEAIAWLEKQGTSYTKKDIDDAYLKGINDAKNEIEKQYKADYQTRKDIATFIFNYRGDIKDRAKWMDYLGVKVYVFEKEDEKQKDKPVLEAVPCKYIDEIKDWLEMQDEKSQDEDEQVMKE